MERKIGLDLIVNTGHTVAKMRIVAQHLNSLADELSTVEDDYCIKDAIKLEEYFADDKEVGRKVCPNCGEKYIFKI